MRKEFFLLLLHGKGFLRTSQSIDPRLLRRLRFAARFMGSNRSWRVATDGRLASLVARPTNSLQFRLEELQISKQFLHIRPRLDFQSSFNSCCIFSACSFTPYLLLQLDAFVVSIHWKKRVRVDTTLLSVLSHFSHLVALFASLLYVTKSLWRLTNNVHIFYTVGLLLRGKYITFLTDTRSTLKLFWNLISWLIFFIS